MVNQYHYELCWLIKEFSRTNKSAEEIVDRFVKANGISSVEDCDDIEALEAVLKVEITMSKRRNNL